MTFIKKADGATEQFNELKLKKSLQRSGASRDEIDFIVKRIIQELHDGMHTQEIYQKAFAYLKVGEKPVAARYSLRRALFGLGPTGFPFEDFLSRLFQTEGYETKTRSILRGKCAEHELDVAAYKADHSFVAEAKFHAHPGIKSDLQVALYSFARLMDLREQKICLDDQCGIKEFWIVTNTKFTTAAIKYAECSGLKLLSWDYPKKGNLHDRIEASGLYPITVLQSISATQKRALLDKNVVVCSDIVAKPHLLRYAHLSPRKIEAVISEARQLTH
jgi:hypothetical protein